MPNIVNTSHSTDVLSNDSPKTLFRLGRYPFGRRKDSMAKRVTTFARALLAGHLRDCARDQRLSILSVPVEILDDHIDRHRIVTRMPAVVIGHQRHRCITELGLAREFRFLKIGHADDRHTPRAIDLGFSPCRKRGTFHADVGASTMNGDPRESGSGSL